FPLTGIGQQRSDSLETVLQLEKEPSKKITIQLALAEEFKTNDLETSLQYARQALDLSITYENKEGELDAMNLLAGIFYEKTQLKTAMVFAVKAKAMAVQVENPEQLVYALYNIGVIYSKLGIYEKSSEMLYECLLLSEQINDQLMEDKVLNSIGIVYHNQKNYNKALEYYLKALVLAKKIGYSEGVSKGLNNVAAIYGIREEYPKVVRYLRESIALNKGKGNFDMLGVNYLNLGYYFQELKQYDSALFYYDEALKIYIDQNNAASIISAKIFLAEYYLELGDLEKSKEFAKESLNDSRSNGLKRFVYETASLLSKIYYQKNDSLQALRYEILELRMKDSLNIEESQTEMSKLELQYKLEKAEQKKQIAQQRKDMITIIVVTSLIFIIIVIILLLSRMRIKARAAKLENDKLEMDLEIRSKELTANVMSIIKKNKALWQIAKRLKIIQQEAVKDETKMAIRKITRELNKAVEDEHWDEFDQRFNQTHSEFYNKLLDRFPKITPQEQRLCAFLRLNMTTKEISEITGQRITTIEMARTRLRKKLDITNTQTNLITFLTRI
ncbi:MAG: hypothetical protein DRJ05_19510, partial [Bacteroidetes bacterium]